MLQRYLDLVYQFFKNSYNYCSKYIVFPGYLHLDFLLNLSTSVLYKKEFGHFSVLGDVDVSDVQHGNFDGIPETVVLDNRLQHAKRDLGKQGKKRKPTHGIHGSLADGLDKDIGVSCIELRVTFFISYKCFLT